MVCALYDQFTASAAYSAAALLTTPVARRARMYRQRRHCAGREPAEMGELSPDLWMMSEGDTANQRA